MHRQWRSLRAEPRRARASPTITGDIEKHGDPAVRLDTWRANEFDTV